MNMENKQWTEENNLLSRQFEFENFMEGVEFINKVAVLAEDANHHPDILLHSYKKVRISLTTHDAGNTVTQKDRDLAGKIDQLT